jgi:hypothetical protein
MAHVRTQIREAMKAALTGLPTTGAKVFKSRDWPRNAEELPALLIYSGPESSEPVDFDEATDRDYDVVVEVALFAGADGIDDFMDQIAVEVENAVQADQTFGGLAKSTTLTGSEPDVNLDGEMPFGSLAMTYSVNYVADSDPEETL